MLLVDLTTDTACLAPSFSVSCQMVNVSPNQGVRLRSFLNAVQFMNNTFQDERCSSCSYLQLLFHQLNAHSL